MTTQLNRPCIARFLPEMRYRQTCSYGRLFKQCVTGGFHSVVVDEDYSPLGSQRRVFGYLKKEIESSTEKSVPNYQQTRRHSPEYFILPSKQLRKFIIHPKDRQNKYRVSCWSCFLIYLEMLYQLNTDYPMQGQWEQQMEMMHKMSVTSRC